MEVWKEAVPGSTRLASASNPPDANITTCVHRACQHLPNTTRSHYTLSQSSAVTGYESSHAVLHLFVTCWGVQGAEGKVREGVNSLAEARQQAGQQQEQGSRALQAQQAATQAAQQQLQAAQVPHAAKRSKHNVCISQYPVHGAVAPPADWRDDFRMFGAASH